MAGLEAWAAMMCLRYRTRVLSCRPSLRLCCSGDGPHSCSPQAFSHGFQSPQVPHLSHTSHLHLWALSPSIRADCEPLFPTPTDQSVPGEPRGWLQERAAGSPEGQL